MEPEFEYCRLSKDDLLKGDSYSIQNQRSMLTDYANKNGFANTQVFIDDGYSGANYERPGFQEMFAMMEQGQIPRSLPKISPDLDETILKRELDQPSSTKRIRTNGYLIRFRRFLRGKIISVTL